jgi:hypothetical protein
MDTFDDIKSFLDHEFVEARDRIKNDPAFLQVLKAASGEKYEKGVKYINESENYRKLHEFIFNDLLEDNIAERTDGYSCSGVESIVPNDPHLYITNHRDILLDPAFMQFVMYRNGKQGTEIAIGDNLMIMPWIKDLVRINRSFIVKRDVGIRQAIIESKRLSTYIRQRMLENKHSIWLAQTEGRTKNGNDATQTGLLKMVNLSGGADIIDSFKELNIIPGAFSYEYNPCTAYFAYEAYMKSKDPNFKKSPKDDMANMGKGFMGYKGRVHFGFGKELNSVIDNFRDLKNNKEKILAIKDFIDTEIYKNYKLRECNYIAYDLKHKTNKFADQYNQEAVDKFYEVINKQKDQYPIDYDYLIDYYINMNSNPLENYLKTL